VSDDQYHLLLGFTAPVVTDPVMKPWENEMERLAVEVDLAEQEEALGNKILATLLDAEDGEFKHVEVNMRGVDGNTFVILGVVLEAMRKAKVPEFAQRVFKSAALAGDYENVLRVVKRWVTVVDRKQPSVTSAMAAFNKL